MKKKGLVLLTVLLLLFSVLPASAAEQRVFDYANLLTAEEKGCLQDFCDAAQKNYDLDLAYLTTNDTEGLSAREYGEEFYISHDMGVGVNQTGVIFVLDMNGREGQIITSGDATEIFSDAEIEEIWNDVSGCFSEGAYFDGMEMLWIKLSDLHDLYTGDDGFADEEDEDGYNEDTFFSENMISGGGGIAMLLSLAAVFSAVIAGVAVMSMRKACKNVKPFTDGRAYLKENGCHFREKQDTFANTHTTMMPIPRDDNNHHHTSGFGGGSASHGSFGGGGGKF